MRDGTYKLTGFIAGLEKFCLTLVTRSERREWVSAGEEYTHAMDAKSPAQSVALSAFRKIHPDTREILMKFMNGTIDEVIINEQPYSEYARLHPDCQ